MGHVVKLLEQIEQVSPVVRIRGGIAELLGLDVAGQQGINARQLLLQQRVDVAVVASLEVVVRHRADPVGGSLGNQERPAVEV